MDTAANEAATSPQNDLPEPSQAQREAGNYKMGHLSGDEVQGLRISIENPQGSTRSGTSPDGRAWSNTMGAHYGYVKGSEAADGDHVDVFVGPAAATAGTVYVVDQVNPDGSYDEAKALFGFNSEAEAVAAYRSSYDTDWKVGPVTAMPVDEFKAGLASGRFKKPVDQSLAATKPARSVIAKMKEAKAKRESKAARAAREAEEARAAYFAPGNIVKGYDGYDRVVSYTPPNADGRWSVRVQAVRKQGGDWVDVPLDRERNHSTEPSARELRAGPEVRAISATAKAIKEQGNAEPNPQGIAEPERGYAPYQHDLFGATVGRFGDARPNRKGVRGNALATARVHASRVDDTAAPAGDYLVNTLVGAGVERKLGARRITTPEQLAQATQYLYQSPVERFDAIVTDRDGVPLAVVGGFKGAVSQASVYPATIVGEAVRVPGAANIWFTHNHPSGTETLSRADVMLNESLANVFRGSGIEPRGLIAVGARRFSYTGVDVEYSGDIPAADDGTTVPVIERQLRDDRQEKVGIDSPANAKGLAQKFYEQANSPGMLMLDSQLRVVAWVPLPSSMRGVLRESGGLQQVYRAVSQSNASAAIMVHGGELDARVSGNVTASQNVAAALSQIDVRPVDSINVATGTSLAQQGLGIEAGPVFSLPGDGTESLSLAAANAMRALRPSYSPDARAQAVASVSKTVDAIRAAWGNGPEVVVAFDMGDPVVPAAARRADLKQRSGGARGVPEGFYYRGKAYLMASRLASPNDAARVLFHEVLGHHGLRSTFGKSLQPILQQIATMRRAEVDAKIKEYGLRGVNRLDRLAAAEEVLAEMAQTRPDLHFVRRAIAAIRSWLRTHVPGFSNLRMTDDEIVRNFILPARRTVELGGTTGGGAGAPRFSRGAVAPDDDAFRRWFGDSKVVDAAGKPQVAFHGTTAQFTAFDDSYIGEGNGNADWGNGFYFADRRDVAEGYAEGDGGRVMEVYLSIKNPAPLEVVEKVMEQPGAEMDEDYTRQALMDRGYDGIIITHAGGAREFIAFQPSQIKSATGNNGNFDPGSEDIRFSRSTEDDSAFAQEVDRAVAAGVAGDQAALREQVPVGIETPPALELLGVVRKPVFTSRNLIAKMHLDHGVPRGALKSLPELLADPVLVFRSDTQPGRMVIVTKLVVQGNPVVVAVEPNGKSGRTEVVYLPSAYPKDNADRQFSAWTRSGLLMYANKAESRQLATTARLQLPGVVQRAIGFKANYKTEADLPQTSAGDDAPMFSRSSVQGFAKSAAAELNKTFNAPGKLSWWHKTVGTMYNLAERSPAFKGVFDAAQSFVDDVSYYATDAAELAPKLLPKLETWRDIKKAPVSAADNAAVAKPVFEGTLTWARDESGKPVPVQSLIDAATGLTADQKAQRLLRNGMIDERMLKAWKGMPLESYEKAVSTRYESRMLQAGVVWSDAELRSMFQLTDGQIALYREFRQATDRSLDTMARADMLRFAGDDAKALRDMVMDAPDAQAAAVLLRDHLAQLASEQPDRSTLLMNTANGIIDRADKVRDLQLRGYAPLSRFGRYTVDVVDQAGERQYFGLFETAREANAMAARMREEFGDAAVSQGTLSEEAFKLFAGVTPETLELFGNALGLDSTGDTAQDQAFQEYLRLTKTNRSAMRRLIHRKGIAGFSEDVGRVLAAFVYSNARQTAAGLHMGDLGESVNAIPKEQGELKDAAVRLAEYVKNPQEEAQAVRGLLFAQYLGGSVASAFVNMSQPVAVTFPWLSQFGGARAAAAQIGRAAKDLAARGRNIEPELAAALKRAEAEGIVAPQEVHQLMAQARGSSTLRGGDGTRAGDLQALGQNAMSRLSLAWGKLFGAAEQVNRRLTFIAAYRTAKAQGMDDPADFARQAITETQFLYSKANKMQWARGAVGGTLMTFKTYSVAYLELLHRMYTRGGPEGKRAALLALAVLLLMGGAGGLPFAEDLEDAADGLAQLLGYNFSAKKARQEFLESFLPRGLAQFIDKGVSGLPGAPLDVSGRLGMGNLIPGTGLLLEKTSHARDVLEIAGPAGDFASRIMSGGRQILTGDVGAGLLEMSPAAVRNAAKGADMATTGMYRDAKGYKVLDTNTLEAALKSIGFQPQSVATIQEANRISQGAKAFYSQRAQEIRALWAQGVFEGDPAKVQTARDQVAAWNRKNPEQPMLIRVPDIMRRVREMRKSKDQRIAGTAPRAMRQQLREDAARARADL